MARAAKQYRPPQYKSGAKRVDRRAYVKQHPLCEDCLPDAVPVAEVDHIIPIRGVDDPLRLQWRNLRSRCRSCHATKTARLDERIRAEVDAAGGDWLAVADRWREVSVRGGWPNE